MAVVKLLCGGCGAELSGGATACPQCGIPVEYPGEGKAGEGGSLCPECGHRNEAKGAFCESCGKKIGGGPGKSDKKARQRDSERNWVGSIHAPAIVISLLFGGWAIYSELDRDFPPEEVHNHAVQETDHSAQEAEIARLQAKVDANPEDDASMLRLANMLQDHASHDQRYLLRAIEVYQKVLARNPQEENARVDLGICFFDLARVDTIHGLALIQRAIKEIEIVAKSNPEHQAAAFNLGIVNLNIGNTEESAEWFRRAAAIDPASDLGARSKRLLEQHAFSETVQ